MQKLIAVLEEICESDEIKDNTDTDLFEAGLMDSLAIVTLLFRIEEEFGLSIQPSEIIREEVCTVNKIKSFLEKNGVTFS